MAKKEKEIRLNELGPEELRSRLEKAQQDMFKIRFRAASSALKNPMEIRKIRRDIARINTFMNQNQRKAS